MNITRIIRYMPVVISRHFHRAAAVAGTGLNYIIDKCHQGELAVYLTGALLFLPLILLLIFNYFNFFYYKC